MFKEEVLAQLELALIQVQQVAVVGQQTIPSPGAQQKAEEIPKDRAHSGSKNDRGHRYLVGGPGIYGCGNQDRTCRGTGCLHTGRLRTPARPKSQTSQRDG